MSVVKNLRTRLSASHLCRHRGTLATKFATENGKPEDWSAELALFSSTIFGAKIFSCTRWHKIGQGPFVPNLAKLLGASEQKLQTFQMRLQTRNLVKQCPVNAYRTMRESKAVAYQ